MLRLRHIIILLLTAFAIGCATLPRTELPATDRQRYHELQAVASPEEAELYRGQPDSLTRQRYWDKFWLRWDPTPTTVANERLDEHQRRVQHAEDNFTSSNFLWDDRGRIYIKYGEPDEREWYPMGESLFRNDMGAVSAALERGVELNQAKRSPVSSNYAWERWAYHRLGRELHFVERDVGYRLVKDIATAKDATYQASLRSLKAYDIDPATALPSGLPIQDYAHEYGQPLDFPFGVARFAEGAGAEVWVYYSLPLGELRYDDSTRSGLVSRAIVIRDDQLEEISRDETILRPPQLGDKVALAGAQGVDVCRFPLAPGDYTLSISLMDLNSGKTGIYQYRFPVVDYLRERRPASDLLLAGSIVTTDDSSRFVRNGHRIVPQAGCTFKKGRDLYLYYEIYNLAGAADGLCRTELSYYILSKKGRRAQRTEPVKVEIRGPRMDRAAGIDLADLDAGEYVLMVEAHDLNDGSVRTLAQAFKIVE
jgi:GWxTD domain-containing protein